MSNERTTQLRELFPSEVVAGDVLPISDVSEITAPSGETKKITAAGLAQYVAMTGYVNARAPYQAFQSANGLSFSEGVIPAGDSNQYCYGKIPQLGSEFSLFTRGYMPQHTTESTARILFGVGDTFCPVMAATTHSNTAFVGIVNDDLIGYAKDNSAIETSVILPNFFSTYTDGPFFVGITKSTGGTLRLFVNGIPYTASWNGSVNPVNCNTVTMGNGTFLVPNVNVNIYDGQVFNKELSDAEVEELFYGGPNRTYPSLIASYASDNLNDVPSLWLDSAGDNHLLLPTSGAMASNPNKKFTLSFYATESCYLGNGTARDVLPPRYTLTSCIVETPGKPLLSIGTSNAVAPVSASGTGSWRDNRVAFTSASYGVNPLCIGVLGVAHISQSIYVCFSGSATPCTISFDGYTRN